MNVGIGVLLGVLILLCPYYLEISGGWRIPFWVAGGLLVLVGVGMTVSDGEDRIKSAMGSVLAAVLLTIIAGGIALADHRIGSARPISVTLRSFVLLLVLMAGTGFLQALDEYSETKVDAPPRQPKQRRRDLARSVETLFLPMIGLATSVVVLVKEVIG